MSIMEYKEMKCCYCGKHYEPDNWRDFLYDMAFNKGYKGTCKYCKKDFVCVSCENLVEMFNSEDVFDNE